MIIAIAMSVSDHTSLKKSYKFYIICMNIKSVPNSLFLI